MSTPKPISPRLSVSSQVEPGDLAGLAAAGFRSIICNRPDGEEAGQPPWAEVAAAAEALGMEASYVPVVPSAIGAAEVSSFRLALDHLPAPVLAYCRSGARSATLWALASAGALPAEEIIRAAAAAGHDLTPLQGRLGAEP